MAVVVIVTVVVAWLQAVASISSSTESFNFIQLAIAMIFLICPFDNLYIHILLEIYISVLLALQVVAIEVVVIVVVSVAVTVVLAVVCTYWLLVRCSSPNSSESSNLVPKSILEMLYFDNLDAYNVFGFS